MLRQKGKMPPCCSFRRSNLTQNGAVNIFTAHTATVVLDYNVSVHKISENTAQRSLLLLLCGEIVLLMYGSL